MTDNDKAQYAQLIDFNAYPVKNVLGILLQDKSTKQNIIYATDAYVNAEPAAMETAPILAQQISGEAPTVHIVPRVQKSLNEQLGAPSESRGVHAVMDGQPDEQQSG